MDDFEAGYKEAIEAGQRNLRATKLLSNWCFHAELTRSPGRGMIEAATGLPIGHMGVQCKFSKIDSMMCWLLEDGVYDFYQSNCKECTERIPVGFPNILDFVTPREEAATQRKKTREEQEDKRKQRQTDRRKERAVLRSELSLKETFVLDLLDELDQEDIATDDPRLEQLANLAPEAFTRKIVEHLLPAVLHEGFPYSIPAAKALLNASLQPEEQLSVALRLVYSYAKSPGAIEVILSNAEKLLSSELINVAHRFASIALGPSPKGLLGGVRTVKVDVDPIRSLFQKRRADISAEVDTLLRDANAEKVYAATKIILAINCETQFSAHTRSIIAKLIRRRSLFPEERRNSDLLYYLREAASKCFEYFPENTDAVIQSFLEGCDDTGRKEAYRIYQSVLKQEYRKKAHIGLPQKIAFRRLLWAAVEKPENGIDDAGQFFRQSWDEFAGLAFEHFDDLVGAAATLSEKYEQVSAESTLEVIGDAFSEIEKSNKLSAIDSLQKSLLEWAAIGAKSNGINGIKEYLYFYHQLPKNQTQMRGNMITHVSKLLWGVDSLVLVLPDWYGALMDESLLVRAQAVRAWEDVPYDLVKNFPSLFFEAYSVLLTDPYVIVHQSAVRALRRRSFPEEMRSLIKLPLWNLIVCYCQESKRNDFIIDCIDTFAYLCLSLEERKGKTGQLLSKILLTLEEGALYRAVDKLHYGFKEVPDFVKVALKSIQDGYTRSISVEDCMTVILNAPPNELLSCADEIRNAFLALKPFRRENFREALLYAAALTKAGKYKDVGALFKELKASIPIEDRFKQWRLEVSMVEVAAEIEHKIQNGDLLDALPEKWQSLLSDLERENEERTKLQNFPSSFFFED